MSLKEMYPIFGKVMAEWSTTTTTPLPPFVFHVHGHGGTDLHVIATDFHSNTFQAIKTRQQLEDLEKNDTLQKQLDMVMNSRKHKSQKINDRETSDSTSALVSLDSPDKQATYNPSSTKVSNRVVPAHRRSKVRGAVLGDTEDDAKN